VGGGRTDGRFKGGSTLAEPTFPSQHTHGQHTAKQSAHAPPSLHQLSLVLPLRSCQPLALGPKQGQHRSESARTLEPTPAAHAPPPPSCHLCAPSSAACWPPRGLPRWPQPSIPRSSRWGLTGTIGSRTARPWRARGVQGVRAGIVDLGLRGMGREGGLGVMHPVDPAWILEHAQAHHACCVYSHGAQWRAVHSGMRPSPEHAAWQALRALCGSCAGPGWSPGLRQ